MASTVLVANTGRPTGSPAARRMRTEDIIPAVLYGRGMTPVSASPSGVVTCASPCPAPPA